MQSFPNCRLHSNNNLTARFATLGVLSGVLTLKSIKLFLNMNENYNLFAFDKSVDVQFPVSLIDNYVLLLFKLNHDLN